MHAETAVRSDAVASVTAGPGTGWIHDLTVTAVAVVVHAAPSAASAASSASAEVRTAAVAVAPVRAGGTAKHAAGNSTRKTGENEVKPQAKADKQQRQPVHEPAAKRVAAVSESPGKPAAHRPAGRVGRDEAADPGKPADLDGHHEPGGPTEVAESQHETEAANAAILTP